MKILRDRSPWFLSFQDESIQRINELVPKQDWGSFEIFTHQRLPPVLGMKIIRLIPMYNKFRFLPDRVSLFITPPHTYYRAHKDGFTLQVGLNFPILIPDNKNITRWYSDELSTQYPIEPDGKKSREVIGFDPRNHVPECSFTMTPDEAVLLNVNRFHDFENFSDSPRVLLTVRSADPTLTYEKAAQLFY